MVKIAFINQGLLIGDFVQETKTYWKVQNPALVISRQNEMILAPLLQLVEEDTITVPKKDMTFSGELFTPVTQMMNSYNKIYGAGIEIANVLSL